jgi:hypothetical protein
MTTITVQEQAALTSAEQQRLQDFESTIQRGLQTFYEVGSALMAIREQRLYRAEYGTFEDYCRDRWGMSKTNANRLVQSAEVVENLTPIGVKPENEAQTRPLAKLPADEQPEAWQEAVERSGGKPTGKIVQQVVQERTQPPAAPAPLPGLPPGWYWQDSSNPADIIAINRQNASQASGFCKTHEEAAARAWEIHHAKEQPAPAAPKKAPAPAPKPEPVPEDLIELLRTVNPDAGPQSFDSRIGFDGKTQYRVSVPTGGGGGITTDWFGADYTRQWMENHIEKLQGRIRETVKALDKIGFRLSGDVVWQRVGQHRLLPFYPISSTMYNPELWSETQVQAVLVLHVRMNDKLRKEQEEVDKARKQLAQLDTRRYEAEQRVRLLQERIAELEEGSDAPA